ncbi:MAG: hypothetical protein ACPGD8_08935, partial [Flavobacteriales bacterium]
MERLAKLGWLGVLLLMISCGGNAPETSNQPIEPELETNIEYGLATDSFIVIKDQVKRNQNLSS